MKVSIEKGELVIRIKTTEPTPSSTGKTLSIASTHGNVQTEAVVNGKPVFLGLNAYLRTK
jgi:hypothetical protein